MSSQEDVQFLTFYPQNEEMNILSEVYNLLQEITREHMKIDNVLNELVSRESLDDFNPIEDAAQNMLVICKKLKNKLRPKESVQCCCHS